MEVLAREGSSGWAARAEAHRARLAPYVSPHLARREAGVAHPVHDFLFTYYSQRPAQLLRWHPGYGTGLAQAPEYAGAKGYASTSASVPFATDRTTDSTTGSSTGSTTGSTTGTAVSAVAAVTTGHVASQQPLLHTLLRLLRATLGREANFGCFGMHEWAMVYRAAEHGGTRHRRPLRLGDASTDAVVESHRIQCSHFDAFRFFTPAAVELNTLRPTAADRPDFEQPACLHAGMDLYKHAFRLTPMICSDVVADAFELAWDIRVMDMRAAPYDLGGVVLDPRGEEWTPVRVETAEGKQEYAAAQRGFATRSEAVRRRLVSECERLLAALG